MKKAPSKSRSTENLSKRTLITDAVAADMLFGADSPQAIGARKRAVDACGRSLKSLPWKTLLNKLQLGHIHDVFCQLHAMYKLGLERMVDNLTDPQLRQLARYFDRQVAPNKSRNFRMEVYADFAHVCRMTLWLRRQVRAAAQREASKSQRKKETGHAKKKSTQRNAAPIAKGSKRIRARKDANHPTMHRS